mgnify:CR=1 FL=1
MSVTDNRPAMPHIHAVLCNYLSSTTPFHTMPRGDKSSYTSKQKRKAEHIEESYEKRGVSKKVAAKRAWATVNQSYGGGQTGGKAAASRSARS